MTSIPDTLSLPPALPDHTQLPDSDGTIVENFQEHPQGMLLTDSLRPVLDTLHPDGQYAIGQDAGIYFRITEPALQGCKAPDWFYIPDVPPLLEGQVRRSYVLWQELIAPLLIIEFASGDGSEERDVTPQTGMFWVYERILRAEYYAIYEVQRASVEVFRLEHRRYHPVVANERGHYPIDALGVELGIWPGVYQHQDLPWLRAWDQHGNLLPTGDERAEVQRQRAEAAEQRAERLAARLRELGVDPDASES
jgi:Uma2 family endonuclease